MLDWVRGYKLQYNLTSFVETGCGDGGGLLAAQIVGFTNLYSCDVNPEAVKNAKQLVPNALIYEKRSVDFLKEILPTVPGQILFWLDAHFSVQHGGPVTPPEDIYPIRKELAIIASLRRGDVIFVDDTRILADQGRLRETGSEYHLGLTLHDVASVVKGMYELNGALIGFEDGVATFLPLPDAPPLSH